MGEGGDDGGAILGALLSCTYPPPAICVELCDEISACIPGSEFAAQCLQGCGSTYNQAPEFIDAIDACIDAAAGECQAIVACVPMGPDACDLQCDKLMSCEAGDGGACEDVCQASIDEDIANLGAIACEITAPCESLSGCASVATDDPPQSCIDACSTADVCGDYGDDACVPLCAGVMAGMGFESAEAAQCILQSVGGECDIQSVTDCLP